METKHLYRTMWRWHFYAGIIFAPILLMLAITGAVYLFKPQLEPMMYSELYKVEEGKAYTAPHEQVAAVQKKYPDAPVMTYRPSDEPGRTAEVTIMNGEAVEKVYVNPYTNEVVGAMDPKGTLMRKMVELHGELMIGTVGDRIIEMAACWAIILLLTGLYLFWPRQKDGWKSVLRIRFGSGKRAFWRDLHTTLGFWLSLAIVLLVLTGLPWAGFAGDYINKWATQSHTGYPTQLWEAPPQSLVPTKDVANVAWAAENLVVPQSSNGIKSVVTLESLMKTAEEKGVHPGYEISFPEGDQGVYTISVFPQLPEDQATLHIDRYTGDVLAELRFKDYGIAAKVIEIGIALHEGRYFGIINQIIALVTCIGLVLIVWSGVVMWWKRRPQGAGIGAPERLPNTKLSAGVWAITIILCILLPLAGASFVAVLLLERVWRLVRREETQRPAA